MQAASCALDASAKIYGYRVDSLHSDTLKLAGGVGKTAQEAGMAPEGGGGDGEQVCCFFQFWWISLGLLVLIRILSIMFDKLSYQLKENLFFYLSTKQF